MIERKPFKICFFIFLLLIPSSVFAGSNFNTRSYHTFVKENKVIVCPEFHIPFFRKWEELKSELKSVACPAKKNLLRQNIKTGEVVILTKTQCSENLSEVGSSNVRKVKSDYCYVDECVPPGTYYYGFAIPYHCPDKPHPHYLHYRNFYHTHHKVEVVRKLNSSCERSKGSLPPETYRNKIPWSISGSNIVCDNVPGCTCQITPPFSFISQSWLLLLLLPIFKRSWKV